jgi:hypothetical protein
VRDANYIKYLETLALSLMNHMSDGDKILKIDEPGITYGVYNARQCIREHQEARAGLREVRGVEPETLEDVLRREGPMNGEQHDAKKILRLRNALNTALDMIADVRYREWPSGTTEKLGLNAENMDMLLYEGELAVSYSKRKRRGTL